MYGSLEIMKAFIAY